MAWRAELAKCRHNKRRYSGSLKTHFYSVWEKVTSDLEREEHLLKIVTACL